MSAGPGKYGPEFAAIVEEHGFGSALLLILEGPKGAGFTCRFTERAHLVAAIAAMRSACLQLEADLARLDGREPH